MPLVLKCKICGGDISVNADMTVGTCQYCGSTITMPRIDSDKKARLFNRAIQYRLNCEFDKAYDAYNAIVSEDEQEAEAYWGMVLSEYGVEYVEDPVSHKRVPTCHRTKIQGITSSTNYKFAIKYADTESRFFYQDEAEELDKLQKNIISVSAKEEPYDVFICYKESDNENGERTKESVVAQDIYDALTDKDIRCFFSRISLERHLGENFEPYIFSALNSARVMLLVASSNENCNSIWVKNEWMRFVQMMSEDKSKAIIPVCVDMSPYELPEELASFQAQDMNKVGAIQDLIHGVCKLCGAVSEANNSQAINTLLEEKEKRDRTKNRLVYGLIYAVVVFASFRAIKSYIAKPGYFNGYDNLSIKDMITLYKSLFYVYNTMLGVSVIVSITAIFIGIKRRLFTTISKALFLAGLAIMVAASVYMKINCFSVRGIIFAFALNVIVIASVLMASYKYYADKKDIHYAIILACLCLIFLLFPRLKLDLSNYDTVTKSGQVYITSEYANVRKEPDTSSQKLILVYEGMIFDKVNVVTKDDYKWYEIKTNNGIQGYIREDLVGETLKLIVTGDYANVRSGPSTDYDKIGKVNKDEIYYSIDCKRVNSYANGNMVWYKIIYKEGYGYVGTNVSVVK